MLTEERPVWMEQGACVGHDTSLWYPDKGEHPRKAKSICATCPVAAQCLEYGLWEPYGVWGGYTFDERKQMRRGRECPHPERYLMGPWGLPNRTEVSLWR